jgi:16S rRNA (uracil1498-N3)-methyltransferase
LTSNRFFIEKGPQGSAYVSLEGKEHHHLSKVSRAKSGDLVWLVDRQGVQHRARVEQVQKDKTRLLVLETQKTKPSELRIVLAQVMLKSKKMDLVIQKSTELGADAVQPILSDRSVAKIDGKQDTKMKRWERIMIAAAKQSGRSSLPEILRPEHLREYVTKKDKAKKFFFSERGGKYFRDILKFPPSMGQKTPDSVILLIGPEGGWTEKEEQDIMGSQYEAVSLGSRILRAETAAIVSLAMACHFWKSGDVS